ncbi:methyl-accepting chemotaxis protein [Sporolactobacillus sp. CPB3-1]|uniref:Methyl-accepting chemotaxis protein n=1 Tax=Sporolactobacillus mangiferae TaxID=2940498 RepID=A0ABT0MEQ9_9BACL|nr:methyl-accepting chemotaxis protein [Sporolactobacillus mangiferae]MCL1632749.1 methyl-accepting chemotaxis protein [Sporolactobacillus mangiferae]
MQTRKITSHLSLNVFLSIFLILVVIIPDLLIGSIIYYAVKQSSQTQLNESTTNSLKIIDKNLTQFFEGKTEMITTLSQRLSGSTDRDDAQMVLDAVQSGDKDEAALYLADTEGNLTFLPAYVKIPKTLDPRTRPWYKLAMKNPDHPVITPPYQSSDGSRAMTVTIAQTTKDHKAVIGMDLELGKLNDLVNQVKLGQSGYAFLLDSTNKWVVNKKAKAGGKASSQLARQLTGRKARLLTYKDQNIHRIMNTFTGWTIGASIHRNEVNRTVNPLMITILLIIVINLMIVMVFAAWVSRRYILNPFKKMVQTLDQVSSNDLSAGVDASVRMNREFTQLGNSVNKMIDSLRSVMKTLSSKSELLAASSEELTASTEENKATTDEIAHSIEKIATASDQQATGIKKLTRNAEEINQALVSVTKQTDHLAHQSEAAGQVVKEGRQKIAFTSDQMVTIRKTVADLSKVIDKLSRQSEEISGIIQVINDVASQTQLLSLNASIEAARAGEHGKGFAVVAQEIQKLSAESSGNADKISVIVSNIQKDTQQVVRSMKNGLQEVEKGIGAVDESNQSFESIQSFVNQTIEEIEKMSQSIQKVADFTEQATSAYHPIESLAEQTSAQTQQVSAATEEQAASIEEVANSAAELSAIADELNHIAQAFKLEK